MIKDIIIGCMAQDLVSINDFQAGPPALSGASEQALFSMLEFFNARIGNRRTRRAYKRAVADFFVFCMGLPGGDRLESMTSLHVAAWRDGMEAAGLSRPTVKARLAALRRFFAVLVERRVVSGNPAEVVRGPKHTVVKGRTPVLTGTEMASLLASIDTSSLAGLRDRALIGCMAYSFARVGAVIDLRVEDVFRQRQRLWLRLREKRGKVIEVPCHHACENYLVEYMERAGLKGQAKAALFQSFATGGARKDGGRGLSGRPLTQGAVWEMVRRRAAEAGIETAVCNHTFRATGITAYLTNGGTIERAAVMAGHASTRTTQLYDRRPDDVTQEEVEKIRFG
ncbi:MAG: tyrosine-type recombinase/integrase [Candidatus Competibacter sp.]|nr:tyrosine-type recombinase/integrase [Candidatus Competibacter sp.]